MTKRRSVKKKTGMCYSGDKGHFGECLTDKWNLVARKSNNNKKKK